jgi:Ca-activated chloride channel family protein
MKRSFLFTSLIISLSINVFADGLIVVSQQEYPYVILKNKATNVDVEINGLIAETVVYQEFENEWDQTIDGVYSFPLPPDARATRLQYSVGDTLYDAVLQVQQQSTTPGTGEGGIRAEINRYMGNNVIKIALKNIAPQEVKTVRLSYIALLKQYSGTYEYNYPLNTGDFVKTPLDYLQIRIKVHSSKSISGYSLPSHPDYQVRYEEDTLLDLEYNKSKAYVAKDIRFIYSVENSPLAVDLYCWKPDTNDGYFTVVGKPQVESADSSLPQNIIFLLGNSTTMIGNKLEQSKAAISLALEELSEKDSFNILIFNATVSTWKSKLMPAKAANIADAQSFIGTIKTQSGNRLDVGISYAFNLISNANTLSSFLVFTDGKSPVDPAGIEDLNVHRTGIAFIAIGDDVDRVRMEAIASRNYGFVSYIKADNVLASEMMHIFQKIKNPIIKEVDYDFDNPGVYSIYPSKYPSIFAGTDFMASGLYRIPGPATITIEGKGYTSDLMASFQKNFDSNNEVSRKLWAKMAIDDLEAQILIYGESDSLKNKLIALSLKHNIRCRYTAYIEADHENEPEEPSAVVDQPYRPEASEILNNYPNPFVKFTILRLLIADQDIQKEKVIEFYDMQGRLLKVIDISALRAGIQEIVINRDDFGHIPNGIILVRLTINHTMMSTLKIMTIP